MIPHTSSIEARRAYKLYGNATLRCPKTDALLEQWIQATRQAYAHEKEKRMAMIAKEKKEHEAKVKWVEEQLALVHEFKKLALVEEPDKASDFHVISFVEGRETASRLRQTILSACEGLPDDVDRYLKDENLRSNLKYQITAPTQQLPAQQEIPL